MKNKKLLEVQSLASNCRIFYNIKIHCGIDKFQIFWPIIHIRSQLRFFGDRERMLAALKMRLWGTETEEVPGGVKLKIFGNFCLYSHFLFIY